MQRLYFTGFFIFLLAACQPKQGDTGQAGQPVLPSEPLFERIDPEVSGIRFSNRITEDHVINILNNSYMYNGGGVAVLDVNQDGLPDLYFSSTQANNRLYLNKGGFRFEDITDQAGVGAPGGIKTGVAVVDINQDGWDDLYVCRTGLKETPFRQNLLFINNTDGTFSEQAAAWGLNDGSPSNQANFFDFDLDGDLDMYLINHPADFSNVNQIALVDKGNGEQVRSNEPKTPYESDRLYRNNGNGTFSDISREAGIVNRAFALSATICDFNQDGYPDIFVANDYIEPDFLYINNRNGTFTNRIDEYFRHQSNHTMGADIADFNNDGLMDLVSLDMMAEDNRRQKLLMSTMLLERYETLVRYGYGRQLMRNTLQLNNGQGSFSEIGLLAGVSNTDWSWSPLLADFDNDGWKDLFITNGYYRDVTNLDYLTYTVDSINRTGGITLKRFPDFNDYLQLIPSERLPNYMYRNRGDLTFEKVSTPWGFHEPTFSNGSAWADLDADGDLDLIVNNIEDPAFVYRNTTVEKGRGHFIQFTLEGATGKTPLGATVTIWQGDLQQVQELRPVRGFLSSVQQLLHFGLPSGAPLDLVEVRWPDGAMQTLAGLQPGQRLTLRHAEATDRYRPGELAAERPDPLLQAADNIGLDFLHRENEFEDFNRERLLPHRLSALGPCIAVGDANGDGLDDFFIGGASGQAGALYLQKANSTFRRSAQEAWNADREQEDAGCLFFDADADGDADLYVVSGGNEFPLNDDRYQDRLYLNDGKGNFSRAAQALPRITASGYCIAAHDYDGDGDQDLFVGGRVSPGAYPTAPQSLILQNDGGRFTDVTDQIAPGFRQSGMVTDLRWGDLDGDGRPEMVVAGEWMPIQIFRYEAGVFRNTTIDRSAGWWNCLALADADGDGDLDILGGNLGLNSRLRAGAEAPLRIRARDFDGNGSIDPILSFYENGKEYPLPRRENLIRQLPGLKKQFVYFGPYSVATLQEVFPANELASATMLEAHTLATTLFRNDGQSRFTAEALPIQAQFAPANQLQIADLNQDGRPDILLVGNNYDADTESGPYDAGNGLILLGETDGTFRPLTVAESGFWAGLHAKDLERLRLADGRSLFLVANNNGPVQGFTTRKMLQ